MSISLLNLKRVDNGRPAARRVDRVFMIEPGDWTHYEVVLLDQAVGALCVVGGMLEEQEGAVVVDETGRVHPIGKVREYELNVLGYLGRLALDLVAEEPEELRSRRLVPKEG